MDVNRNEAISRRFMSKKQLWSRWTLANALSELIGLGLTFAITGLFFASLGEQNSVGSMLLSFVVAVLSGAVEATIVGLAQWWAMRPWFPSIERFAWWRGTLIGALIAYVLGYLPSTLMSMSEATASTAPVAEPAQWIVLLLAAGMGAVGGAVLSFAQWLVMRGKVQGAGLWIPANMLAWLFGMPVIFWGIDLAFKMSSFWKSVVVMAGALFAAGAVVGAIHGLFLMRLAEQNRSVQTR
jgi:magnesium-transporting ATPase (P-type)